MKKEQTTSPLKLPPMSRKLRRFSMALFFLLGVGVTTLILLNPIGLPFLKEEPATMPASSMTPDTAGAETVYQCPMHPHVVEAQPGDCPICGMKLVPVKVATEQTTKSGEREILYWYAPMDPTYIRKEPGESPMGMKLVPKYADETGDAGSKVIEIDPVQVQNIGVVSVEAERGSIAREIRTVGILDFNADNITWINTKFTGWIEKVHVAYVGQEVHTGDPMFDVYSPDLVTTQEEYLRAIDYEASLAGSDRAEAKQQAKSLLQSTYNRLRYWDIDEAQIAELAESKQVQRTLTVRASADGVVVEVMDTALEGMFIKPGMNLYKIADLSTIWVHAEIYESDLPWVSVGQPVTVSFRYEPEREIQGRVLFLNPEISEKTRTLKICVEVANKKRNLRPGMYADVSVFGPASKNAILIPQSAVLHSGERDLVFIDLGKGHFAPREVILGVKGRGDLVQVFEGVSEGERVVTQAQFMLDSESRVREAIAKFVGNRKPVSAQPQPGNNLPVDRKPQGD